MCWLLSGLSGISGSVGSATHVQSKPYFAFLIAKTFNPGIVSCKASSATKQVLDLLLIPGGAVQRRGFYSNHLSLPPPVS